MSGDGWDRWLAGKARAKMPWYLKRSGPPTHEPNTHERMPSSWYAARSPGKRSDTGRQITDAILFAVACIIAANLVLAVVG